MRFLHTSDVHLGAVPDRDLPWSEERARAIRNTFQTLISIAGKQQTDLLLIAGDFFHHQPLRRECREVNDLFASIPETHVVIIAGSRDFICDTSPYLTYPWSSNVTILSSSSMSSAYFEDINTEVHGLSYHSPEITEALYDRLHSPRDGRLHILLGYGGDEKHIPIHMRRLAEAGFDYVALGGRRQPALSERLPIAWSGSPEPADCSDIGRRGYIMGTLTSGSCQFNWYPCSFGEYQSVSLNVTPETTEDQIVSALTRSLAEDPAAITRVVMNGRRSPAVAFDRDRLLACGRIIGIQDDTVPDYDLEEIRRNHARDLTARLIECLDTPEEPVTEAEKRRRKALEYGLRALLAPEG